MMQITTLGTLFLPPLEIIIIKLLLKDTVHIFSLFLNILPILNVSNVQCTIFLILSMFTVLPRIVHPSYFHQKQKGKIPDTFPSLTSFVQTQAAISCCQGGFSSVTIVLNFIYRGLSTTQHNFQDSPWGQFRILRWFSFRESISQR